MTVSAKAFPSLLFCAHPRNFQILEVLDFLDFYFDLEVLFVIEMGLHSAG